MKNQNVPFFGGKRMAAERLRIHHLPQLADGRMIVAFSGWMDGGNVSTGTVEWLVRTLGAEVVADIDPEGFSLYNFPGSMEIAALFRPHARIEDGVITQFQPPENILWCSAAAQLILFQGKEPNFNWRDFADCLFDFAAQTRVTTVYFVGSVAGAVPHSREPRLISSVSDEALKPVLSQYGVHFANYEGPASFSTLLISQARARGLRMASLVVEIPAYIQGTNPKGIDAAVRKLAAILGLQLPLGELRELSAAWEERLNEILEQKPELAKYIRKLEADHDNEVFDTEMGDLKAWLEQQGIRVD
jgi:proteasome assembly chaperone (PAC2) family protein